LAGSVSACNKWGRQQAPFGSTTIPGRAGSRPISRSDLVAQHTFGRADKLLHLALDLLFCALDNQPGAVSFLADRNFGLAYGLIGRAFRFVDEFAHDPSPLDRTGIGRHELQQARSSLVPAEQSNRRLHAPGDAAMAKAIAANSAVETAKQKDDEDETE
jgi:hypothetical protein